MLCCKPNVCSRQRWILGFPAPVIAPFCLPAAAKPSKQQVTRQDTCSFYCLSKLHQHVSFSQLHLLLPQFIIWDRRWTAAPTLQLWDGVIGCTENLLPGSLRTNQSSLTCVIKAALLAACSSCHGNPSAVSPIVWTARYPESFFQPLGVLKPRGAAGLGAVCSRVHILSLCVGFVWRCVCVCVWAGHPQMEAAAEHLLHLTFTADADIDGVCVCGNV